MRSMFVGLFIFCLALSSLILMPITGAEIIAQVQIGKTDSQPESVKKIVVNTESWEYWGPQRYWTELQ